MLEVILELFRNWFVVMFGASVSASFSGMKHTRKNILALVSLSSVLFVLQYVAWQFVGSEMILKIYPLFSHVPIAVFVALYLKRPWLIAVTSVLTSFICFQLPRFIDSVAVAFFGDFPLHYLIGITSAALIYYLLQKYCAKPIQELMERSVKSCLLFGSMPAFYYLFNYAATVYTDFVYSEAREAVQLLPFVASVFYLVFVILYNAETQKQATLHRERDMLEAQYKQAQTEFASLRQMQQNAAAYRHDMRHHFSLLQFLALEDRFDELKEYLKTAQSDMDAITPIRFCENETVNLILSSFSTKAKQSKVLLTIEANLPESLPFSDTELCSLLSNALENAIHASKNVADTNKRLIKLRLYSKNNKLCIDIRNTYQIEPIFHHGLPVSSKLGHGFGTKSMVHIVEKHGGIYRFTIKSGWFIFQATA